MSISNNANPHKSGSPIRIKIYICLFDDDKNFLAAIQKPLNYDIYDLNIADDPQTLISLIQDEQHREQIDCLLMLAKPSHFEFISKLQKLKIFIPAAIAYEDERLLMPKSISYHAAEVKFQLRKPELICASIDLALTQFLNLNIAAFSLSATAEESQEIIAHSHSLLESQQIALADKLKERLNYLGIFYKRNPQDFYRNLAQDQKEDLDQRLAKEYRQIILNYFEEDTQMNQIIDRFVNLAFFADVSVSQILEIHMDLMGEFSQQLKLEKRSEDILLDYRLALVDIIAHLCEMYRRSIPREETNLTSW